MVSSSGFDLVAEKSFPVDQSGLTGCIADDMAAMFSKGDNVAQHLSGLFGASYRASVSANEEVCHRTIPPIICDFQVL